MILGVLSIAAACLLWSLVFVIPSFMEGCSILSISLFRFLIYGFFSFLMLLLTKQVSIPKRAFLFAFFSTIGCYTPMLLSMHYGSPELAAFLFAIAPVAIAFFGNRELSFKKLLPSLALITCGVILTKYQSIQSFSIPGIFFGILSLSAWTFFAVINSRFLQTHPEVSSKQWSLQMGSATFLLSLFFGLLLFPFLQIQSSSFSLLLIGSTILGLFSTTIPFFLWNYGSQKLPTALTGQLMVLEILFALMLIYTLEKKIPDFGELLGILSLCLGLFLALRQQKTSLTTQ